MNTSEQNIEVAAEQTVLPQTPEWAKEETLPQTPVAEAPKRRHWYIGGLLLVIPVALGVGFIPRWHAQKVVAEETRVLAVPTVTVVSPEVRQAALGMPLPAELTAFTEAPIYARASGYLKRWLVDIGDKVQAGQLLAEIDTPELDQELDRARADVKQVEASLELAQTTASRWSNLVQTASVSVQESAEKQADLALKSAMLQSARANLRRLEDLQGFTRVLAPFKGTITARKTDVGQLIAAGGGQELFRLAQTSTLRVFVHVPQELSHALEAGQGAEVTLPEMPGRVFQAKVVRTAGAMEADSRTLVTELELDNSNGELLAGSYAQVRFTQTHGQNTLTVPSNTLLFRAEGMQVGVVGKQNKIELRKLKLGRDYGQTVEVLEGLNAYDRVILNPSDSIIEGTVVRLAGATQPERLAVK